jgi:hypothetical protein
MTDAERIDALAYHLMRALDTIDEKDKTIRRLERNLRFADGLIELHAQAEEMR